MRFPAAIGQINMIKVKDKTEKNMLREFYVLFSNFWGVKGGVPPLGYDL